MRPANEIPWQNPLDRPQIIQEATNTQEQPPRRILQRPQEGPLPGNACATGGTMDNAMDDASSGFVTMQELKSNIKQKRKAAQDAQLAQLQVEGDLNKKPNNGPASLHTGSTEGTA